MSVQQGFILPISGPRVRRSIQAIEKEYLNGTNKAPLIELVTAFKRLQEKEADDPYSFFTIAGFHGQPFQLRDDVENLSDRDRYLYWGGYCPHGNVLFPTWHRAYLLYFEAALQSVSENKQLSMPYWDETSKESIEEGIPWIFRQKYFPEDSTEPNPMYSYKLPKEVKDFPNWDQNNNPGRYDKPAGYETVRFPYSGLVSDADRENTENHNKQFDEDCAAKLLQWNVNAWLTGPKPRHREKPADNYGVIEDVISCLKAPNYTVFSTTTAQSAWNVSQPEGSKIVVSLESPHNSMHLCVGGFDMEKGDPSKNKPFEGIVRGANGDMGENNTSAFDPMFQFHHCFIDKLFWMWQTTHNSEDKLELIEGYPGTNSNDVQGPTPQFKPGEQITLKTDLQPFRKNATCYYNSNDMVNIYLLGYTYDDITPPKLVVPRFNKHRFPEINPIPRKVRRLVVRGIDKRAIVGSFVVHGYCKLNGSEAFYLGFKSVLNRFNMKGCANCQTRLFESVEFRLKNVPHKSCSNAIYWIEIHTHDAYLNKNNENPGEISSLFQVEYALI